MRCYAMLHTTSRTPPFQTPILPPSLSTSLAHLPAYFALAWETCQANRWRALDNHAGVQLCLIPLPFVAAELRTPVLGTAVGGSGAIAPRTRQLPPASRAY